MRKFKNAVALVLSAIILASSATGCSSSPSPSASSAKPAESVTSTADAKGTGATEFWFDKGNDQEIVDRVAAAWKADSGVDIKITNYPDTAAYQTAVQQSIDQPTAPGLFTWWSGSQLETLAKNGKIADLTAEWKNYIAAGVSPDIEKAFTFDGKAYAAPYSILYNTCLYNTAVFEKAGVKETPKTFDEFLAACEKIKQSGVTPIGLKNDSWASFIWFEAIVASYNPQLYKDVCTGAKKYTDPEMKKVLEVWKGMFDKGYFAKPVLYSDLYKDFAKGQCAIMLEASPTATSLVKDYGMTSGETVDAFVLPSVTANSKSVIFFEASPLCVAQNSKDKNAAIEALRNFYKPATQKVMVVDNGIANTSGVPVEDKTIQNIIKMTGDSSKYELILRYYENTPSDIRDVALTALSKFMDGAASVDDTLNTIQAKADEVFKK
jgi:multiple sugar transport system substrate-binding protein